MQLGIRLVLTEQRPLRLRRDQEFPKIRGRAPRPLDSQGLGMPAPAGLKKPAPTSCYLGPHGERVSLLHLFLGRASGSWQLQNRSVLSFGEIVEQHDFSIRKFQRIVMLM